MFKNYFIIAMRNISRQKGIYFINISGLAVGMGCCMLILLWVQDELSYEDFHENAPEIYRVLEKMQEKWVPRSGFPLAELIKNEIPEVNGVTRYLKRDYVVEYGTESEILSAALVDPGFFEIFTFPLVEGGADALFEDINSVIISKRFSERFFRGEDPVGKVITVNKNTDVVVKGIMENVPENSHLKFEYIMSIRLYPGLFGTSDNYLDTWAHDSITYLLLNENVSINSIAGKISTITLRNDELAKNRGIPLLQPISQINLRDPNGSDPVIYIYILSAIAVSILLIACFNYMNLATARSVKRAKEVGMRKVIGALRKDIILQNFSESVLATLIALIAAYALVLISNPFFNNLTGKQIEVGLTNNLSLLLTFLGIAAFTGFVSGSYPALHLSSYTAVNVLKSGGNSGIKSIRLRRILVTGQYAVTIVLIAGTIVVNNQLEYIKNKDFGLNKDQVIAIKLNRSARGNYFALKSELRKHPDIIEVSAATSLPTMMGSVNPVYWEGRSREDMISINWSTVDYDYFELFEMEMLLGRKFSRDFSAGNRKYIINEAALKLTGLEDPIGKMFSYWENEGEIIGVVKDFHNKSLHTEITPAVFMLTRRMYAISWVFVKIRPENIPETINSIKNTSAEVAPDLFFNYQFLDEYFDLQYNRDMQTGAILRHSSFLAIFISCLGLFGMVSYITQERSKEFGVRKVLGASIWDLIYLISREYFLLITISSFIAWPVSFRLLKLWLDGFAYKSNPDIYLFAGSTAIALIISLLTVGYHIVKAVLANPVDSLRYE